MFYVESVSWPKFDFDNKNHRKLKNEVAIIICALSSKKKLISSCPDVVCDSFNNRFLLIKHPM